MLEGSCVCPRLITFQCYKCRRFPPFCEYLHEAALGGGKKRIYSKWWLAPPPVRRSPPNVVPVIDYFPSKNVLKEAPRFYYSQVLLSFCSGKWSPVPQAGPNCQPRPLNLNHVHDQDQDNPCLVNVIPLLRLKCALLLTITLATVSFKLSMFLHLCAIIASTYSLLVTLLRRLPNVNFLLSTKLSLSYQKCMPHYVRTV